MFSTCAELVWNERRGCELTLCLLFPSRYPFRPRDCNVDLAISTAAESCGRRLETERKREGEKDGIFRPRNGCEGGREDSAAERI